MAGGNQPGRGKYGRPRSQAVENVISLEDRTQKGYLHNPFSGNHGPMYGHGFAMLFLGEVHGMVHEQGLRDKASRQPCAAPSISP